MFPFRIRYLLIISVLAASALLSISVIYWLPNILVATVNQFLPDTLRLQYSASQPNTEQNYPEESSINSIFQWNFFDSFSFKDKQLSFDNFHLIVTSTSHTQCTLLNIHQPRFVLFKQTPTIEIDSVTFDMTCLSGLSTDDSSIDITWATLDEYLPFFLIDIKQFAIFKTPSFTDTDTDADTAKDTSLADDNNTPIYIGSLSFLNSEQKQFVETQNLSGDRLKIAENLVQDTDINWGKWLLEHKQSQQLKLGLSRNKQTNQLTVTDFHLLNWFEHSLSAKANIQLNESINAFPNFVDAEILFDSPFLPTPNSRLSLRYEPLKHAQLDKYQDNYLTEPLNDKYVSNTDVTHRQLTVHLNTESLKNNGLVSLFEGVFLFNGRDLSLENASWNWPYWEQPLSGFTSIKVAPSTNFNGNVSDNATTNTANRRDSINAFTDFISNLSHLAISAHFNILTEAKRGKSNLVFDLPPTKLAKFIPIVRNTESHTSIVSPQDSNAEVIPIQITGQFNYQNLSFGLSIPAQFEDLFNQPTLHLMPGALLRFWGALHSEFFIEEARFPLAGIYVNQNGINGRLQAILKTREALWGKLNLHLDGDTQNFWLSAGNWAWKAWGSGNMPFLKANWDVESFGEVQDGIVTIQSMTSGFDKIEYGWMNVIHPRITLMNDLVYQPSKEQDQLTQVITAPFILLDQTLPNPNLLSQNQLPDVLTDDTQNPNLSFNSQFVLNAQQIEFSNGGMVTEPTFDFDLFGTSFTDFQFKGELFSKRIAAMQLSGRWDGERLRGNAWWPKQSVSRLRALFSPYTDIELFNGDFYAQGSFSAAPDQGFLMGGHLVFDDVDARYNSHSFTNMDFILPYRLENQRWQFGRNHPVTLRIEKINNLLEYRNLAVDLQGFYPFDSDYPLVFTNIGTQLLGGQVKLEKLRLPQEKPVTVTLDQIDSSQFWQLINPKQFSMSGKLGGKLNLSLNDPDWLLKESEIYNQGDFTFRLDTDFLNTLKASNPISASAIDWLSYLEIDKFKAKFNVDNLGNLDFFSQINATNRQLSTDRSIHLSYHHQENIYLLWQSLIFKEDLHDWLEESLKRRFIGFDVSD